MSDTVTEPKDFTLTFSTTDSQRMVCCIYCTASEIHCNDPTFQGCVVVRRQECRMQTVGRQSRSYREREREKKCPFLRENKWSRSCREIHQDLCSQGNFMIHGFLRPSAFRVVGRRDACGSGRLKCVGNMTCLLGRKPTAYRGSCGTSFPRP